jgi:hypothetical protein
MQTRTLAAASAASLAFAFAVPARGATFYGEGTAYGGASSWADDPTVLGALHLGAELFDWVSPELLVRLGYGAVDTRIFTTVGIGTKLALPIKPVTPHVRVTAIHAHETPIDAMGHDAFGHVMGVGDGIRHRFGVEGALGATVIVARVDDLALQAKIEGFVDAFPDERGPAIYGGGGLGVGIRFE